MNILKKFKNSFLICFFLILGFFILFIVENFAFNRYVNILNFNSSNNYSDTISNLTYKNFDDNCLLSTTAATTEDEETKKQEIIYTIKEQTNKLLKTAETYKDYDTLKYSQYIEVDFFVRSAPESLYNFLFKTNEGNLKYGAKKYLDFSLEEGTGFEELAPYYKKLLLLYNGDSTNNIVGLKDITSLLDSKYNKILTEINVLYSRLVFSKEYSYESVVESDREVITNDYNFTKSLDNDIGRSYINSMPADTSSSVPIDKLTGSEKYDYCFSLTMKCLFKLDAKQAYRENITVFKSNIILSKPVLDTTEADRDSLKTFRNEVNQFRMKYESYLDYDEKLQLNSLLWQIDARLDIIKDSAPDKSVSNWYVYFWVILTAMILIMLAFAFKLYFDFKNKKEPYYKSYAKDSNINARVSRGKMPSRLYAKDPNNKKHKK